ncbi:MAG: extracellular solute-binding protein, partial [Thiohalorhabdaceae bacterium]
WSTVLAYDPAAFPDEEPPERMEALFDLDKFPGKRGLRKSPKGNLEWALIADGVAPERVYEVLETDEGLDRAFRVLSRIK